MGGQPLPAHHAGQPGHMAIQQVIDLPQSDTAQASDREPVGG